MYLISYCIVLCFSVCLTTAIVHRDLHPLESIPVRQPSVVLKRRFSGVSVDLSRISNNNNWCSEDVIINRTSGELKLPSNINETVSAITHTFILKLRLPLPILTLHSQLYADVLDYLEAHCAGVAAAHFGTGTLLLHSDWRVLVRCFKVDKHGYSNHQVMSLTKRLCYWHFEMQVEPTLQILAAQADRDLNVAWQLTHLVAVVAPNPKARKIASNSIPSRQLFIAKELDELFTVSGFTYQNHNLKDVTADDLMRHFVCDLNGFAARRSSTVPSTVIVVREASHCNVSNAIKWIQHNVLRVHRVEYRSPLRFENKFSRGILQTGRQYEEPFMTLLGINGEGSVVGVGDTGIDYDHCFFDDPLVPVPLNSYNARHRKIVRYMVPYHGAQGDHLRGHGTHVAGSIAGKTGRPEEQYSDFHGVVPEAKLSVWDLSTSPTVESVSFVSNFNEYFGLCYDDGARVHSNSWGSSTSYDSGAFSIDTYTHRVRDMLVVFAAGNNADEKCKNEKDNLYCDRSTVISPSIAKNCISVGASMGSYDSWKFAKLGNYYATIPGLQKHKVKLAKGSFSPSNVSALKNIRIVFSQPKKACTPIINAHDISGVACFIYRGECKFNEKIQRAQDLGAAAVIIINSDPGDPIVMGCPDGDTDCGISVPSFMIDIVTGNEIFDLMEKNNAASISTFISITATDEVDTHKGEDNLSEFSSHGPTPDFRYKPDLVAVGELVISAYSDAMLNSHNCDVWASQGTSMATPLIAGLAVMLREYFMKGFHDNGVKNITHSLIPSAAFLKASLIHTATPLTGVYDRNSRGDWRKLGKAPTFEQGFGIPRLNTSFPTAPNSVVQIFTDDASSVTNGGVIEYCIRYNGKGEAFKATLVWSDPPAAGGAVYQLVDNLDLVVVTPNGDVEYHGNINSGADETEEHYNGVTDAYDVVNNVEKVRLLGAPAGVYRVRVLGTNLPSGSVKFALLASGKKATNNVCASLCAARCVEGSCTSKYTCKCRLGWIGYRCDHPMSILRPTGSVVTVSLEPTQWAYFLLPSSTTPYSLSVFSLKVEADINVFVCKSMPNTRYSKILNDICVVSDSACDNCGNRDPLLSLSISRIYNVPASSSPIYLGVTATCCYPGVVEIKMNNITSNLTQNLEITGISTTKVVSKANFVHHANVTNFNGSARTLQFRVSNTKYFYNNTSDVSTDRYIFLLQSNAWKSNYIVKRNGSSYLCHITAIDGFDVTCSISSFSCSERGEFYAVSLLFIENNNRRTVLDAPHPSALSLRCGEVFSFQSNDSNVSQSGERQGTMTVMGFRRGISISKKIILREGASSHDLLIVGSHFSNVALRCTVQLLYLSVVTNSLVYGKGIFINNPSLKNVTSHSFITEVPYAAVNEARYNAVCHDNTPGCAVRILYNIHTVVNETYSQLVADLSVFIIPKPYYTSMKILRPSDEQYNTSLNINTTALSSWSASPALSAAETVPANINDNFFVLLISGGMFYDPRYDSPFESEVREATTFDITSKSDIVIQDDRGGELCVKVQVISNNFFACLMDVTRFSVEVSTTEALCVLTIRFGEVTTVDPGLSIRVLPSGVVSGVIDNSGASVSAGTFNVDLSLVIIGTHLPTSVTVKVYHSSVTSISSTLEILRSTHSHIIARLRNYTDVPLGTYKVVVLTGALIISPAAKVITAYYFGANKSALLMGIGENVVDHLIVRSSPASSLVTISYFVMNFEDLSKKSDVAPRLLPININRNTDGTLSVTQDITHRSMEACHVVTPQGYSVGSPSGVCRMSPFAYGAYIFDIINGVYRVPLLPKNDKYVVVEFPFNQSLEDIRNSVLSTLRLPLLLNVAAKVEFAGVIALFWNEEAQVVLSATACYDKIAPISTVGYKHTNNSVVSFTFTPSIVPLNQVYLCATNTEYRTLTDTETLTFYTALASKIPLLAITSVIVFQSAQVSARGTTFDVNIIFKGSEGSESSSVFPFYAFVDMILSNESCTMAAKAQYNQFAELIFMESSGSATFNVTVRNVVFSDVRGRTRISPRVCVALSSDSDYTVLPSSSFVTASSNLDCYQNSVNGNPDVRGNDICNGRGECNKFFHCHCDPWFGGPNCSFMCQVGFNGRTCSGLGECISDNVCECSDSTITTDDGTTLVNAGPACHIPTRVVYLQKYNPASDSAANYTYTQTFRVFQQSPNVPVVLSLKGEVGEGDARAIVSVNSKIVLDVAIIGNSATSSLNVELHTSDKRLLWPAAAKKRYASEAFKGKTDYSADRFSQFTVDIMPCVALTDCFLVLRSNQNNDYEPIRSMFMALRLRPETAPPSTVNVLINKGIIGSRGNSVLYFSNTFLTYSIHIIYVFSALVGVIFGFSVFFYVTSMKNMLDTDLPVNILRRSQCVFRRRFWRSVVAEDEEVMW